MCLAPRSEACCQVFPEVVISSADVSPVDLVDDAAVTIQQATDERKEKVIGDRNSADRQALPRREPYRPEPFIELRVVKLCVVGGPACFRRMTLNAVVAPEQPEIGFDELAIAGFEVDGATTGDEASIRGC